MDYIVTRLFRAVGKKVTGWVVGAVREVDVPLDDETLLRISVVPNLAREAADGRDQRLLGGYLDVVDRPPITIQEGLAAHFNDIKGMLVRCPCHREQPEGGSVWALRRSLSGASPATPAGDIPSSQQIDRYNNQNCLVDEIYACLPYLCRHWYDTVSVTKTNVPFLGTFATEAISNKPLLPYRGREHFSNPELFVHRPGCQRHLQADPSDIGYDTMGPYFGRRARHRYERLINEISCVWCHWDQLHCLNPLVYTQPMRVGRAMVGYTWMKQAHFINRWLEDVGVGVTQIQITAWDSDYCPIGHILRFLPHVFVLVGTLADHNAVLAAGMYPLLVFRAGNNSSLGCGRVYVACGVRVGMHVLVTNATAYWPITMDMTMPPASPVETHGASIMAPTVNMCWIVSGAVNISREMVVTRAGVLSGQYAIEENFLMRASVCVHRADHFLPLWNVGMDINPSLARETPLVLRALSSQRWAVAKGTSRLHTMVTRQIVLGWRAATTVGTGWTQAAVLPLGTRRDRGPVPVRPAPTPHPTRLGEPTTLTALIADEVGSITWFVMGSRGDIVPIQGLAKRLSDWGFVVDVVCAHTDEEGIEMLGSAERGQLLQAAPIFLRTMTHALTAPGFVLGPPEIPGVHMGVSLRPPSDIVWPADFGTGVVVNFLIEYLLRGWSPIVNVGAYRKAWWLPRSHNGEDFLPTIKGGDRPIPLALVWGSSTLPRPVVEGAVEPPDSDHIAFFSRVKTVMCHGGAGTVQTAAACGARVVAATSVLDRNYRNKTNAGLGVEAGADPDLVVLTLLPYYPKVWLWAYRHSWRMLWAAITWASAWIAGPAVWLSLALLFRTVRVVLRVPTARVVFTPSFIGTLLATFLSRWLNPWTASFASSPLLNIASYALGVVGVTPVSLALTVANVLAQASLSPLTWWLAVSGLGWAAIPLTMVLGHFRVGSLILVELLSILIGAEEGSTNQTASVGISLAFPNLAVPAFHTRFISPDGQLTFEGTWVSGQRGLGALYQMQVRKFEPTTSAEWVIPTRVPWAYLESAPRVSAPYSTLWNCQSGMMYAIRGMWGLLGMTLLVLAPMGLWMILASSAMTLFTLLLVFFMDVVPVLSMGFMAAGQKTALVHTRAIVYQALSRLTVANQSWFETAVSITTGLSTGWATPEVDDIKLVSALLHADSVEELVGCRHINRGWSQLNLQIYSLKLQLLSDREAHSSRSMRCARDLDHI